MFEQLKKQLKSCILYGIITLDDNNQLRKSIAYFENINSPAIQKVAQQVRNLVEGTAKNILQTLVLIEAIEMVLVPMKESENLDKVLIIEKQLPYTNVPTNLFATLKVIYNMIAYNMDTYQKILVDEEDIFLLQNFKVYNDWRVYDLCIKYMDYVPYLPTEILTYMGQVLCFNKIEVFTTVKQKLNDIDVLNYKIPVYQFAPYIKSPILLYNNNWVRYLILLKNILGKDGNIEFENKAKVLLKDNNSAPLSLFFAMSINDEEKRTAILNEIYNQVTTISSIDEWLSAVIMFIFVWDKNSYSEIIPLILKLTIWTNVEKPSCKCRAIECFCRNESSQLAYLLATNIFKYRDIIEAIIKDSVVLQHSIIMELGYGKQARRNRWEQPNIFKNLLTYIQKMESACRVEESKILLLKKELTFYIVKGKFSHTIQKLVNSLMLEEEFKNLAETVQTLIDGEYKNTFLLLEMVDKLLEQNLQNPLSLCPINIENSSYDYENVPQKLLWNLKKGIVLEGTPTYNDARLEKIVWLCIELLEKGKLKKRSENLIEYMSKVLEINKEEQFFKLQNSINNIDKMELLTSGINNFVYYDLVERLYNKQVADEFFYKHIQQLLPQSNYKSAYKVYEYLTFITPTKEVIKEIVEIDLYNKTPYNSPYEWIIYFAMWLKALRLLIENPLLRQEIIPAIIMFIKIPKNFLHCGDYKLLMELILDNYSEEEIKHFFIPIKDFDTKLDWVLEMFPDSSNFKILKLM